MARYEHLPIYRAAFDLAYLYVAEQAVGMAKQNEGWLRTAQRPRGRAPASDRSGEAGHDPNRAG
ncbi:MAG: hypothetical protein ACRDHY_05655 [Anaerolineales bacterium]